MTHGSRNKKSLRKLPMFKRFKNAIPKTNRDSTKNETTYKNGAFEATSFFGPEFMKKNHKRETQEGAVL